MDINQYLSQPPAKPVTLESLDKKLDHIVFMLGVQHNRQVRIETRLVRLLVESGLTADGHRVAAKAIDLGEFKPGVDAPFPSLTQEIPA